MLTTALLVILGLFVVLVVVVSLRRSDYRVARSLLISAPAAAVFPEINDLRRYHVWNPFGKADPQMKTTFDGPGTGPGAILDWAGNNRVGAGRMAITESQPSESVRMRLDFLKPFPSTADAEFTLIPEANGTRVTWVMSGRHSFVPKAMGLLLDFNKLIGGEFEKGLTELKRIVESKVHA